MIFTVENSVDIQDPADAVIAAALRTITPHGPGFFALTADDGSYVQTAGARMKLCVEYRRQTSEGYTHYVLGYSKSNDHSSRQINSSVGFINLLAHEILDSNDATEIFCHFMHYNGVPKRFTLRDDTARFAADQDVR